MLQLIPEICFIYHLPQGSRGDDHCQDVNFFFQGRRRHIELRVAGAGGDLLPLLVALKSLLRRLAGLKDADTTRLPIHMPVVPTLALIPRRSRNVNS